MMDRLKDYDLRYMVQIAIKLFDNFVTAVMKEDAAGLKSVGLDPDKDMGDAKALKQLCSGGFMFKLIGFIVVLAVVVIGYPALSRWYAGESSPQETVEDVRNRVGSALITDGKQNAQPQQQQQAGQPAPAPTVQNDNAREPMIANQMIKNMMKD